MTVYREKVFSNSATCYKKSFSKQKGTDLLSSDKQSRFSRIRRKAAKIGRRTLRTIGGIAVVAFTAATINYYATHSSLNIMINKDSTKTYLHPDKGTTHLLNVLAGKEKFTEEDIFIGRRFEIECFLVDPICERYDFIQKQPGGVISLIKHLDELPSEQIKQLYAYYYRDSAFHKLVKMENNLYFDTTKYTPDKKIYDLVWTLEQECGNPRVRLIDDLQIDHYNPLNNTIYKSFPFNFRKDSLNRHKYFAKLVIDEMSHAKQFNDDQIGSYLRGLRDVINIFEHGGLSSKTFSTKYKKTYGEPGTIEHEAHQIIQPYLEKKYPLIIEKKQ